MLKKLLTVLFVLATILSGTESRAGGNADGARNGGR